MAGEEVLKYQSLSTVINALKNATAHSLAVADVDVWSHTVDVPPATTGVDGSIGAYFTSDGLLQRLIESSNAWADDGDPLITYQFLSTSGYFQSVLAVANKTTLDTITDEDDGVMRRIRTIDTRELVFPADDVTPGTDTIDDAGDIFSDGDAVVPSTTDTLPAPLVLGRTYYTRDTGGGSLKLSNTPGGSAIDLTDAGTGTHTLKGANHGLWAWDDGNSVWVKVANEGVSELDPDDEVDLQTGKSVSTWSYKAFRALQDMMADLFLNEAKIKANYFDILTNQIAIEAAKYSSNPDLLLLALSKITVGEPLPIPVIASSAVPNPPSGFRYLFLDADSGALVSKKANGSLAYNLDSTFISEIFIGTCGQSNMVGQDGDTGNPDYPFPVVGGYYWDGDSEEQLVTDRPPADDGDGSMMNYLASRLLENPHVSKVTEVCGAVGGAGLMEVSGSSAGNNWSATGNLRAPFLADLQSYEAAAGKGPDFILFQGLEQEASWISGEGDQTAAKATAKAAAEDFLDWIFAQYPDTVFVFNELGSLIGGETGAWTKAREICAELADEYVGGTVILGSQLPKTLDDLGYMIGGGDVVHWDYRGYQLVGEDTADIILNYLINK